MRTNGLPIDGRQREANRRYNTADDLRNTLSEAGYGFDVICATVAAFNAASSLEKESNDESSDNAGNDHSADEPRSVHDVLVWPWIGPYVRG